MITKFLDKWLSTDGGEQFYADKPPWFLGCALCFSGVLIFLVVVWAILVFLP